MRKQFFKTLFIMFASIGLIILLAACSPNNIIGDSWTGGSNAAVNPTPTIAQPKGATVTVTPTKPPITNTPNSTQPTPATTPNALPELSRGKTGKKLVSITFDAGETAPSARIMPILNQFGIKLTFFVSGQFAQKYPDFVKQLGLNEMEIGNHSWSHPDFTKLTNSDIADEIRRTEAKLIELTGQKPSNFFRFPYGARDANTLQAVNKLGYRSIFWTLDSLDSVGEPKSVDFLVNRINSLSDSQLDGAIILMHVGAPNSATALPTIIQQLQVRGFKIVPVSQLL